MYDDHVIQSYFKIAVFATLVPSPLGFLPLLKKMVRIESAADLEQFYGLLEGPV